MSSQRLAGRTAVAAGCAESFCGHSKQRQKIKASHSNREIWLSARLKTPLVRGAAVAAGVLACRRAGASRPADMTNARRLAIEDFLSPGGC
jgi:hypothetical protein